MTKPVSVEALRRHLSEISGSCQAPVTQIGEEPVIDIERSAELQLAIGPAKLADMFEMLSAELPARLRDLRSAALRNDQSTVRAEAHSLKGAAANVGAMRIARAAKAVELALAGTELELALAKLGAETAAAVQSLPHLIQSLDPAHRRTA